MSATLPERVRWLCRSGCFDTVTDIKKGIRNKDEASALIALGQLKEQIILLGEYIESLERASESKKR